ncbi:hypothetical protein PG985_008572 [Apiospora marii]|uniref:Uncharacterized protein n=1 Tax=Apiospora marii TaxID=335849 RepID=A0ABR1R3J5_9PEZI
MKSSNSVLSLTLSIRVSRPSVVTSSPSLPPLSASWAIISMIRAVKCPVVVCVVVQARIDCSKHNLLNIPLVQIRNRIHFHIVNDIERFLAIGLLALRFRLLVIGFLGPFVQYIGPMLQTLLNLLLDRTVHYIQPFEQGLCFLISTELDKCDATGAILPFVDFDGTSTPRSDSDHCLVDKLIQSILMI